MGLIRSAKLVRSQPINPPGYSRFRHAHHPLHRGGRCWDFTVPAVVLRSGRSTGVKHGTRLSATAISMVLWAVKIEPLSESHCTGCGARIAPRGAYLGLIPCRLGDLTST